MSNLEKKLLFEERHLKLYHYTPKKNNTYKTPILLVPPLMTGVEIFDLCTSHSFVNELLENGFNVYLIDFTRAERIDHELRLGDYILNFLYRGVHLTQTHSNSKEISLIGYSLGGTTSLVYSSVSVDIRNNIKNVVNIVGPVDFSKLSFFKKIFLPYKSFWANLVQKYGCLPKEIISIAFKFSNPISFLRKPFKMLLNFKNKIFMERYKAMEDYFKNFKNFPATAFKEAFEIIEKNGLVHGNIQLLDKTVNLSNCTANILNIYGSKDSFIPPDSIKSLGKLISSSDYTCLEFPRGHFSIMASTEAKHTLWVEIIKWLEVRS